MKRFLRLLPPKSERQRTFAFWERSGRHERWFKVIIIGTTCVLMAAITGLLPRGRYFVASLPSLASRAVQRTLAVPAPRAQIDDEWRRYRLQGIADSHRALIRAYDKAIPAYQGLLRYAGLDPDRALLRWGNYNRTLLLPSTVFEADLTGRSYRLLPCIESIWLRGVTTESGVLMFFLVPDRPELFQAALGTGAIPVEQSRQTTNSWGLRGPDPDLEAPIRGIVLGDSFMQGLFIGDDQTPPECLKRYLETQLKTSVSILNTGVLGYSPEQYYYSLLAFADRFRPQVVIVSICANDFGDGFEALQGTGDWEEGRYWLDQIDQYCRTRKWPCLFVTVPFESQMLGRRKNGYYPGTLSNVLNANALTFLNPTEAFINAHLDLIVEGNRQGRRWSGSPLFNAEIGDGHFSARGAEVWAAAVGRRLVLLLQRDNQLPEKGSSISSNLRDTTTNEPVVKESKASGLASFRPQRN
jgi:lysophospholipase L1-like esterase